MTRDEMAEKIMLIMLTADVTLYRDPEYTAARAYKLADAMIGKRK